MYICELTQKKPVFFYIDIHTPTFLLLLLLEPNGG